MSGLVWEEPPARQGGRQPSGYWQDVASQLRSRPGEWAVVATDVSANLAVRIKQGTIVAFAAGDFESRVSGTTKGRAHKVYARFVGEVSP